MIEESMKHHTEVLKLLKLQIGNDQEVKEISDTALEVAKKWVKPLSGGKEQTNGLIYGYVQSGKTGVLSVTGAIAADEGYRTIIILTSDIDPLYEQTLGRVKEAFPGINIIGKSDFKNTDSFLQSIKSGTCAIVATKNTRALGHLVENFKQGNVKGLTCLVIDDEADQASLNTKESKGDGDRSKINAKIEEIRTFFDKNTYLQVTATPQALFLQTPKNSFRPKFTVLSHPGNAYVGGDDFFGDGSTLVREFGLHDIDQLIAGSQPDASLTIPVSLLKALDTFIVGATYKRMNDSTQNCAFLCHVSTRNSDHNHIVELLQKYRMDLAQSLKNGNASTIARLRKAYEDLSATDTRLSSTDFNTIVSAAEFYAPGIAVKLVNGQTDEDVAVRSPFNLFVGGNKLGRGVTIKNLLVSYYGRNPKKPQADTVLQHARMYGYRRPDIGLLRLFLPPELHVVFKAINKMEKGLRDLIAKSPTEEFRGVYVEGVLNATRRNVLAPGAIGVYSAGSNYNPAQMLRDDTVKSSTTSIDSMLSHIADKGTAELSIAEIQDLIRLTMPDQSASEHIWNPNAVAESLAQFAKIYGHTKGQVYIDRQRDIEANRRETAGILSGGEVDTLPRDKIALYMLRMKPGNGKNAVWWPQIRFPDGRYAFAFAI